MGLACVTLRAFIVMKLKYIEFIEQGYVSTS